MNHTSKIIVIGTNHHNTLSMVRSFGESGHKVTLIIYGSSDSYVASSTYVERSYIEETSDKALERLLIICSLEQEKPVVITCPDEISSKMDLRYDEFINKCYFFNAGENGRITQFMDKKVQLLLSENCGFDVPVSLEGSSISIDVTKISYPCFVKPKESIHGGKNFSVCKDAAELKKALNKFNPKYNVLVQDYIEKEYEIVILGLSINEHTFIPGFVRKHREFRGGTTYSSTYPISELKSSLVESCKNMIKEIGYKGLWGIELIKQGDKYYFLELNMRNDATSYSLAIAGANLPKLYYDICMGINLSDEEIQPVDSINSMVEFEDFNFVLKRNIKLVSWIKQLKSSKCRYFYSAIDLSPYREHKKEYLRFLRKRIFHI